MTQWLIVQTPSGASCWPVDDDPGRRQEQIDRARALAGFPPGEAWIRNPESAWRLMLSVDRPHPNLGARDRDPAELAAVAAADVQAWRDADLAANRQRRVAAARDVMTRLTPEERTQAIGEIPPRR